MIDIDTIRRANPLPDVAAKIIALRPAGKEWQGCCPFHPDRSPSFTIFDAGRRFQCFGCGASGDVLDFVQRAYHVTLPEAARMLGAGDIPKVTIFNKLDNGCTVSLPLVYGVVAAALLTTLREWRQLNEDT